MGSCFPSASTVFGRIFLGEEDKSTGQLGQPLKPRVRGRNKLPDEVLTTKGQDLGPGVLSCPVPSRGWLSCDWNFDLWSVWGSEISEALAVEMRDLPRPSEVRLGVQIPVGLESEVSAR